jgi:hypothetical protein
MNIARVAARRSNATLLAETMSQIERHFVPWEDYSSRR